jgi:hypothetical protein
MWAEKTSASGRVAETVDHVDLAFSSPDGHIGSRLTLDFDQPQSKANVHALVAAISAPRTVRASPDDVVFVGTRRDASDLAGKDGVGPYGHGPKGAAVGCDRP